MERIAMEPQADWLGAWTAGVRATARALVDQAANVAALPVIVAYDIPHLDCAGAGAAGPTAYRRWIADLAAGIGDRPSVVILEPDALAGIDCLARPERRQRISLLRWAVGRLTALPRTVVYLDAGNPGWVPAATMARRLRMAGVSHARGFAVNVANYYPTTEARAYGDVIAARLRGARFVIDTSRNGARTGAAGWCNPPGRRVGPAPTTRTGDPRVDAFLWIKRVGESDGACNGGPPAGTWSAELTLGLSGVARSESGARASRPVRVAAGGPAARQPKVRKPWAPELLSRRPVDIAWRRR